MEVTGGLNRRNLSTAGGAAEGVEWIKETWREKVEAPLV